jgi:hypothetical protein
VPRNSSVGVGAISYAVRAPTVVSAPLAPTPRRSRRSSTSWSCRWCRSSRPYAGVARAAANAVEHQRSYAVPTCCTVAGSTRRIPHGRERFAAAPKLHSPAGVHRTHPGRATPPARLPLIPPAGVHPMHSCRCEASLLVGPGIDRCGTHRRQRRRRRNKRRGSFPARGRSRADRSSTCSGLPQDPLSATDVAPHVRYGVAMGTQSSATRRHVARSGRSRRAMHAAASRCGIAASSPGWHDSRVRGVARGG